MSEFPHLRNEMWGARQLLPPKLTGLRTLVA